MWVCVVWCWESVCVFSPRAVAWVSSFSSLSFSLSISAVWRWCFLCSSSSACLWACSICSKLTPQHRHMHTPPSHTHPCTHTPCSPPTHSACCVRVGTWWRERQRGKAHWMREHRGTLLTFSNHTGRAQVLVLILVLVRTLPLLFWLMVTFLHIIIL